MVAYLPKFINLSRNSSKWLFVACLKSVAIGHSHSHSHISKHVNAHSITGLEVFISIYSQSCIDCPKVPFSNNWYFCSPSGTPSPYRFPHLPTDNPVFHEVPLCNSCLLQFNSALLDIHLPPRKMLFLSQPF